MLNHSQQIRDLFIDHKRYMVKVDKMFLLNNIKVWCLETFEFDHKQDKKSGQNTTKLWKFIEIFDKHQK